MWGVLVIQGAPFVGGASPYMEMQMGEFDDKAIESATNVAKSYAASTGETKTVEIHVEGKDVSITVTPDGTVTQTEKDASPFDPPVVTHDTKNPERGG